MPRLHILIKTIAFDFLKTCKLYFDPLIGTNWKVSVSRIIISFLKSLHSQAYGWIELVMCSRKLITSELYLVIHVLLKFKVFTLIHDN
jgi:hypothetical protein